MAGIDRSSTKQMNKTLSLDEIQIENFTLLEGDTSLSPFPTNLITDLQEYFGRPDLQNSRPRCFITLNTSILAKDGREAFFKLRTGGELLQARFRIKDLFVTVLKEKYTSVVNGGQAFMVMGKTGTVPQGEWSMVPYQIWTPREIIDKGDSKVVRMIKATELDSDEDPSNTSSPKNSPSIDTSGVRLRDLVFLDGDKVLEEFPTHLIEYLKICCARSKTDETTCVRGKSTYSISTYKRREAYFETMSSQEKLLHARFKYGSKKQIVIVKDHGTKVIGNGQAVIVVAVGSPGVRRFSTHTSVDYQIWTPDGVIDSINSNVRRIIRNILCDSGDADLISTDVVQNQMAISSGPPRINQGLFQQDQTIADHEFEGERTEESDQDYDDESYGVPSRKLAKKSHPRKALSTSATPSHERQKHLSAKRRPSILATDRSGSSHKKAKGSKDTPIAIPSSPFPLTPQPIAQSDPVSSNSDLPQLPESLPFIFYNTSGEAVGQPKTLKTCNTMEKLFAQARIATLIKSNHATLKPIFDIEDGVWEHEIVRDDADLFDIFMTALQKAAGSVTQMKIVPGDE